jgi:hypothetical protein
MKKSLPVIFLITAGLMCRQHLFAQFVKSIGGTNAEYGEGIAYDALGNTYIIGDFRGKEDFDPGPGTYFLKSSCPCDESDPLIPDIFFAKYSKSGALIWANKIGGGGYDYGKAIGVDSSGNVYITGSFESTADFDPGAAVKNLISYGGKDIYLAKYNPNGEYMWAENIGGVGFDESNALFVNAAGKITIAGYFGYVADFDPSSDTTSFDAGGSSDPFFARYDTNGNLVWAKDIAGNGESSAQNIFIDAAGFIYLTGNFFGTADFNTGTGVFNLTGAGAKDAFYAKYKSTGDFVWAASVGNAGDQTGQSIVADKNGNVYATGYFVGTVDFNPGSGVSNLSSNNGFFNAYLLKLNKHGAFVWVNNIGGSQDDIGLSLAIDAQQNIYTAGYFNGTASFSSNKSLTTAGSTDIFIAVYKPWGSLVAAIQEGGATDDWASSIAIDGKGSIYLTGYYTNTAQFNINGNPVSISSEGNADVYFLKAKRASLQTSPLANIQSFIVSKSIDENKLLLYQNTPNPFASTTNIKYYLPASAKVRLSIVDMKGNEVLVLKNAFQDKGEYNIQLSASNLANGIYVCRLQTNNYILTKKLVVNK